jgi:hypothetical protein
MKALSIREPWASLIIGGRKPIENRDWTTNYRGPLLIHASKTLDRVNEEHMTALLGEPYEEWHMSTAMRFGGIIGTATLVAIVRESSSPWFVGRFGWVLENARPLPFVALRGMPGLFEVSDELVQLEKKEKETQTP